MKNSRGLTLIELLIVITLIAILSGLGLWGISGIMNAAKNKETVLWLATIESGLTDYSQDHGIVPIHPTDPNADRSDSLAREGAFVLYRHLAGDDDGDGHIDPDGDAYIATLALEFQSNSGKPSPQSAKLAEGIAVIDPRGDLMRYLASLPNLPPEKKVTRNPDYDLWSLGGGSSEDPSTWITNWGEN